MHARVTTGLNTSRIAFRTTCGSTESSSRQSVDAFFPIDIVPISRRTFEIRTVNRYRVLPMTISV